MFTKTKGGLLVFAHVRAAFVTLSDNAVKSESAVMQNGGAAVSAKS
jgi:hypothetical protein